MYYLIRNDDGETFVREMTKEQIEAFVNDHLIKSDLCWHIAPSNTDTNYWGGKYLIIKGQIVVPKPVEVVKRYELP